MATHDVARRPEAVSRPGRTDPEGGRWASAAAAISFLILLGFTRAVELGDTQLYANDIADHLGKTPFGTGNSLWDVGHLLWRPLGWALVTAGFPFPGSLSGWTPFMRASLALMSIVILTSVVTVWLWFRILAGFPQTRRLALPVTLAFACGHGFLLYAHSGCAYIPGLACLSASFYLLLHERMKLAALLFAAAIVLWLPYVLAGPALALVAGTGMRFAGADSAIRLTRVGRAAGFVLIAGVATAAVFGLALAARGISSPSAAAVWFTESGHGWSQTVRGLRILTGLPRSFLFLGRDGVVYRRFLRHDPYAPVSVMDLMRSSLWKIAAFNLFVVALVWELWHSRSRAILTLLAAAATPVILFACFVFEPSSPERYLPALPFVVLATAWALRAFTFQGRAAQYVIAAFLALTVCNNLYYFSASVVSRKDDDSRARIAALRTRFNDASYAAILSNQDEVEEFLSRSVFDPINRPRPFPVYDVIQPATTRVLHWREEFAFTALRSWDRGGEIWLSRRLLSARPKPAWSWVEGDDSHVRWSEIPEFFTVLGIDAPSGGEDGFLRLTPDDANRRRLAPLAAAYMNATERP